jgi:hypothetical protein
VASASRHREWAARNEAIYKDVRQLHPEWSDWAITILFYAALHELKAVFIDAKPHFQAQNLAIPQTHAEIKAALRTHPPWKVLAAHYGSFLGWSKRARYHCYLPADMDLDLAERELKLIRDEISAL